MDQKQQELLSKLDSLKQYQVEQEIILKVSYF